MKHARDAVGLVVAVFAASAWAETPAPKPDPEMKKLEMLVGHWTYQGEYKPGPVGPTGKFSGEVTYEMILGGFILQGRFLEKGVMGDLQSLELCGYDPANKNYHVTVYSNDGSHWTGAITVSGTTWSTSWKLAFGGKQYLIRATDNFSPDWTSFAQKGEISTDGKAWATWWEMKVTKVKPAAQK